MISTPETRAHAQEILDQIHAEPSSHDQSTFASPSDVNSCGTTACVAGWSAMLSGWSMADVQHAALLEIHKLEKTAQSNLGLTDGEANYLFYAVREESAVQALKKIVAAEETILED